MQYYSTAPQTTSSKMTIQLKQHFNLWILDQTLSLSSAFKVSWSWIGRLILLLFKVYFCGSFLVVMKYISGEGRNENCWSLKSSFSDSVPMFIYHNQNQFEHVQGQDLNLPGRWAVWCSSLCVAAGLWRWTLGWTVWCDHGHSGSDMPRGSLLPPPGSLAHLSSGQCWQHWGRAGSPSCLLCPTGEDGFPGCWTLRLVGNSVKTKLTHNIVTFGQPDSQIKKSSVLHGWHQYIWLKTFGCW